MKKRSRGLDIFNLSFLDIISCGFGAVVLLVLIFQTSDLNVDKNSMNITLLNKIIKTEALYESLRKDLKTKESRLSANSDRIIQLKNTYQITQNKAADISSQITAVYSDISGLNVVEQSLLKLATRSTPKTTTDFDKTTVGGIPVDSDYVIFIIDTSGSMQQIWPRVITELENILNIHPKISGFQILNDNGAHILTAYRGRWIPDTPKRRKGMIKLLKTWNRASNSSPVEGVKIALRDYVSAELKVSIYIFGDEYSGSSFSTVVKTLSDMNTNRITGETLARVHGIGFVSKTSTGRYATLLREIALRNNGTFIALPP